MVSGSVNKPTLRLHDLEQLLKIFVLLAFLATGSCVSAANDVTTYFVLRWFVPLSLGVRLGPMEDLWIRPAVDVWWSSSLSVLEEANVDDGASVE